MSSTNGRGLYGNIAKDMADARFVLNELELELQAAGWDSEIDLLCERFLFALARLFGACRMQEVSQHLREQLEHHDVLGSLGRVYDKAFWLASRHEEGLANGRPYPIILKILDNFMRQAHRKKIIPEE